MPPSAKFDYSFLAGAHEREELPKEVDEEKAPLTQSKGSLALPQLLTPIK